MAWIRVLVGLLMCSAYVAVDCAVLTKTTCQYGGRQYGPGKIFEIDDCRVCVCDTAGSGDYSCGTMACWEPPCSDPVTLPGLCCPTCPDGPNCKAYDGTVIKQGDTVTLKDGAACSCVEGSSWASLEAECTAPPTPSTTLPPGTCTLNGVTFAPGEKMNDNPCMWCICDENGSGQHFCAIMDCAPPACWDAVTEPGQCCATCPNGPNCKAHDGTIIPRGETVTLKDGAKCSCGEDAWGPVEAICTVTVTCEYNGQLYQPGDSIITDNPCEWCTCDENGSGQHYCAWMSCAPPACFDSVTEPGQCCPTCPNGPNCQAYDGTVITQGESVTLDDGSTCVCGWGFEANCIAPPPPSTGPPPGTCVQDGVTYAPGEHVSGNACGGCECSNSGDGTVVCWAAGCVMPPCGDAVTVPGQCCPSCPNGPNCDIDGQLIPEGESVTYDDGRTCTCLTSSYVPQVQCTIEPVQITMP